MEPALHPGHDSDIQVGNSNVHLIQKCIVSQQRQKAQCSVIICMHFLRWFIEDLCGFYVLQQSRPWTCSFWCLLPAKVKCNTYPPATPGTALTVSSGWSFTHLIAAKFASTETVMVVHGLTTRVEVYRNCRALLEVNSATTFSHLGKFHDSILSLLDVTY